MNIPRRGFLQGLLTSAVGGTALVKLATPTEAAALTVKQPVLLGQPNFLGIPENPFNGDGMAYVRRPNGKFEAIGFIHNFKIETAVDSVVSWDGEIEYVPGLKSGRVGFRGPF